jgi:hypothetical protein
VISQSVLSRKFVRLSVGASGVSGPANPTGDVIAMAFTTGDALPGDDEWVDASWASTSPRSDGRYIAQCLVGPGGTTTLAAGSYSIWLKIIDSPEIPCDPVGLLTIT